MVVDMHTHAGSYEEVMSSHQEHLDKLLHAMDEGGVDHAFVLPIPTGPDQPVSDEHNEEFISNISKHEELTPFCCVDAIKPRTALEQLRRAVDLGARGWKFHPILQDVRIDDALLYPAYAYASEHGIPVLVHVGQFVGHRIAGKLSPGPLRLAHPIAVDTVAEAFPDLKMIMAHFGWPWVSESIAIMQRRDNVYVDLSGWAPKLIPDELRAYIFKVRPEKFLFGTDFPFISPARWLTEFKAIADGYDESVYAAVTSENVDRVLNV